MQITSFLFTHDHAIQRYMSSTGNIVI